MPPNTECIWHLELCGHFYLFSKLAYWVIGYLKLFSSTFNSEYLQINQFQPFFLYFFSVCVDTEIKEKICKNEPLYNFSNLISGDESRMVLTLPESISNCFIFSSCMTMSSLLGERRNHLIITGISFWGAERVDTPQLSNWYSSMAYFILFFSWILSFRFSSLIPYSYIRTNASGLPPVDVG